MNLLIKIKKCEWKDGKFRGCGCQSESIFYISNNKTPVYKYGCTTIDLSFCPFCGADIRKPEPEQPIIKKSGGTWVARFDGVDYLSMHSELVGTVGDKVELFLRQVDNGVFKPISEIEITDEIAKLSPIVVVVKCDDIGSLDQLLRVIDGDYVIYNKHADIDCYIADPEHYKLATVSDLEY